MAALVSSSFRRDDSRRRRKERDTCSTDKCTKMTSSEKKKEKRERTKWSGAARFQRHDASEERSTARFLHTRERTTERERERGRGGWRINGRHSGKPPAKSTCDRFISLLEAPAVQCKRCGKSRIPGKPNFSRGKMDSHDEKGGKIPEPPELVISWDTANIFFILR